MDKHIAIIGSIFLTVYFMSCAGQRQQPIFVSAPGSPLAVTGGPGNVVVGDLNNDSKQDLIIACGSGRSITIMLGQGNGQFVKTKDSPISLPESPGEMTLNDFNADSHLDLALANHDSYGITLLLGDGKGNLKLSETSPIQMKEGTRPHTHGLASGDINGDGSPDLITGNNEDNDVSIVLNNGKGEFFRAVDSTFPVLRSPYPLAAGDLNHDGLLDLAVSSTAQNTAQLTVMLGNGHGGFNQKIIRVRTIQSWYVTIGFVNSDEHPDIVATHSERPELTVLFGDGKGEFTEVPNSPFDLGNPAWGVVIADVNGDHHADVIAAASTGISVLLGDSTGNFQPATGSPFVTGKGTWRLALGDFNNDGKPDVVATNLESNNVSILLAR